MDDKMKTGLMMVVALSLVFGWSIPVAQAQGAGASKDDLCFRHDSEAMVYDCEKVQRPHHPGPEIQCYDPVKEEYITFEKTPEWTELTGEDCTPPEPRSKTPRGEDGDEQTK